MAQALSPSLRAPAAWISASNHTQSGASDVVKVVATRLPEQQPGRGDPGVGLS